MYIFDDDDWIIKSRSNVFFNEVFARKIKCYVHTNLCPTITRDFSFFIGPGFPLAIFVHNAVGESGSIAVVDGQEIDSLRFTVHDEFENRTFPDKENRWVVRLGLGPLSCEKGGIVNENGELFLRDIRVNSSKRAKQVEVTEQAFRLIDELNPQIESIEYELMVTISPKLTPSSFKVCDSKS